MTETPASPQKPYLLQLRPLPVLDDAQERLARQFNVIELWKESDPDAVIDAHADRVTALTTTASTPTPASLMDRLPNLKVICGWGVGYDSIDVKHAQSRG